MAEPAPQSDYDKLRRIPWFYAYSMLTATAMLCTASTPLTLFSTELGLTEDRIGILVGIIPFFQVLGVAALPLIARFGNRQVAAWSLFLRYAFLGLFFFAPALASRPEALFALLLTAMIGFSFLRTMSETAVVPWNQEFMPRAVRGRASGRNALVYVPVALVVSWLIQLWLDSQEGLWRFYPVFAIGIVVGFAGALSLFGLKGGAPPKERTKFTASLATLRAPLRDRNFLLFLYASASQYLVFTAINLFMILYFRQRLGISSGQLVLLAAFMPVGGAAAMLVTGWFVDRYGTRGIRMALQAGQVLLLLALPFVTAETPALEFTVAMVFFAFGALFQAGMGTSNVYMFNIIPPAQKEAYTTVHYSIDGIVGGGVTFLAGFLLAWLGNHPLTLFGVTFGNFEVLFVLAALVAASSAVTFVLLREDGAISMRDFVGHFSTGSPMRALWSIQQYGGQTSEDRRRDLAFGFAAAGSPLASQELIEALRDPSFDVRHEAIRALGHLAPSPKVVSALVEVLRYDGLVELQYSALTALGRMRARSGAAEIARFLDDPTPILRARAIRSLGEIRAQEALPRIRALLTEDPELDCRLAAVSALGKFKDKKSLPALLALYREQADDTGTMAEPRSKVVLLALAKILSVEESFSQQWRREDRNPGHALPDVLMRLAGLLKDRAGTGDVARQLRALVAVWDPTRAGEAMELLCSLRRQVVSARHEDAWLVAKMMDAFAGLKDPHPAALVLLAVAMRRVLR